MLTKNESFTFCSRNYPLFQEKVARARSSIFHFPQLLKRKKTRYKKVVNCTKYFPVDFTCLRLVDKEMNLIYYMNHDTKVLSNFVTCEGPG